MLLCCPCNDHPMFAFVPIAKYLFANPLPVSFEKLTESSLLLLLLRDAIQVFLSFYLLRG